MQINLSFEVGGGTEDARRFLTALASPPDRQFEVNVDWCEPILVPGIGASTVELLGTIGVISLPMSVLASVVANFICYKVADACRRLRPGSTQTGEPKLKVTLTIFDLRDERISRIELTNLEDVDKNLLRDAILRLSDDH